MTHVRIEPAIHYWGTPVALLATSNADGTPNVAPMSSVWWLGWSCMLGLDASSRTTENLRRHPECVINLADASCAPFVDWLARTTGSPDVPVHKRMLGYRSVTDKLAHASLTTTASIEVGPPRIAECPVQLEARVVRVRPFAQDDPRMAIASVSVEARIVAVHVRSDLVLASGHVDASRWRPLLMSFRRLFAMGDEVQRSRLDHGSEDAYAPWKGGALRALAGRVLATGSRHRYGVRDDEP